MFIGGMLVTAGIGMGHPDGRQAQRLGDLFVRPLFDMSQHERFAVNRGHFVDGLEDTAVGLLDHRIVRGAGAAAVEPVARLLGQPLPEVAPALVSPAHVDRGVPGHPVQPVFPASGIFQRVNPLPDIHPDPLHYIVNVRAVAQDRVDHAADPSLVTRDELGQDFTVTGLQCLDQKNILILNLRLADL